MPAAFLAWFSVGIQSFGGGASTWTLIEREFVRRREWITDAELARDMGLCQLAPGITLLALTILIGRRLGGPRGIAAALAGLLLPSVAVTLALTACYSQVQGLSLVQAALRGIIPAVVGMGLMASAAIARPLLQASRNEGRARWALAIAILGGSAIIEALFHPPAFLLLGGAGLVGGLGNHFGARSQRRSR
jgi:chromate transporter